MVYFILKNKQLLYMYKQFPLIFPGRQSLSLSLKYLGRNSAKILNMYRKLLPLRSWASNHVTLLLAH